MSVSLSSSRWLWLWIWLLWLEWVDAATVSAAGKLNVLALHGFGSSGAIFNLQMRHLESHASDMADFTFADGTFAIPGTGSRRRPRFSWWSRQGEGDESVKYEGMHDSLAHLWDMESASGRLFEVILGHSQGAAVAMLTSPPCMQVEGWTAVRRTS